MSINKRKRVERVVPSTENTKAFVFETKPALGFTRGHLYMHTPTLTLFLRVRQLVFILELIEAVSMREHHLLICCSTFSQCTISQAPFLNTERERKRNHQQERQYIKKRKTELRHHDTTGASQTEGCILQRLEISAATSSNFAEGQLNLKGSSELCFASFIRPVLKDVSED